MQLHESRRDASEDIQDIQVSREPGMRVACERSFASVG
jgi:hypothetical protein